MFPSLKMREEKRGLFRWYFFSNSSHASLYRAPAWLRTSSCLTASPPASYATQWRGTWWRPRWEKGELNQTYVELLNNQQSNSIKMLTWEWSVSQREDFEWEIFLADIVTHSCLFFLQWLYICLVRYVREARSVRAFPILWHNRTGVGGHPTPDHLLTVPLLYRHGRMKVHTFLNLS